VSPTGKGTLSSSITSNSNISPSKKRPFISTSKSNASFGEPPPLPPRPPSPERQVELAQAAANTHLNAAPMMPTIPIEPDILSPSHAQSMYKQSFRWLNLSATFWALIVMDAHRSVDKESLENFFDVMDWRAHGKITEQEFSALYMEWIGKPAAGGSGHSSSTPRKKHTVGVFAVRQLLLERRCVESDLDLLIGMVIHETNRSILNSPINFLARENAGRPNATNLEVCTRRWISLSEELFFSLDTPGYGFLRFDEFFFLASCLAVGLQGWSNESELESDFSIGSLTALALQMMREAGAAIMITSNRKELLSLNLGASQKGMQALMQDRPDIIDSCSISISQSQSTGLQDNNNSFVNYMNYSSRGAAPGSNPHDSKASLNHKLGLGTKSSYPQYGKYSVTLPMFKALLLKKGMGEAALSALTVHVQSCIERLSRITSEGAAELHQSFISLESISTAGSPRLWQQAVLTAAGYDYESERNLFAAPIPPLILFLLTDAEKLIPGALRASESGFSSAAAALNGGNVSPSINPDASGRYRSTDRVTRLNVVDELHETAHTLWQAHRSWGSARHASGKGSHHHGHHHGHHSRSINSATGNEDGQKDPAYQLILSALVEYKIMQHQLCAALFDMTMAYYGLNSSANAVSILCARLMPNPEAMILELGLDDGGAIAHQHEQQAQQPQSRYGASSSTVFNNGTPPGNKFADNYMTHAQQQLSSPPIVASAPVPAGAFSPYVRAQKIASIAPTVAQLNASSGGDEVNASSSGFFNHTNSAGRSGAPIGSLIIEEGTGLLKQDRQQPSSATDKVVTGSPSQPPAHANHSSSANWKLVFDARTESLQPPMRSPGRPPSPTNREQGWMGNSGSPNTSGQLRSSPTGFNNTGGTTGGASSSPGSILESLLIERLMTAKDPGAQLELVEQLRIVRQSNAEQANTATGINRASTGGAGVGINSGAVSLAVANSLNNNPDLRAPTSKPRRASQQTVNQQPQPAPLQNKIPIIEKSSTSARPAGTRRSSSTSPVRRTSSSNRAEDFLSSGSEIVGRLDGNVDRLLSRRQMQQQGESLGPADSGADKEANNNTSASPPPSESSTGTVSSSVCDEMCAAIL
jgi:hypothetical protein